MQSTWNLKQRDCLRGWKKSRQFLWYRPLHLQANCKRMELLFAKLKQCSSIPWGFEGFLTWHKKTTQKFRRRTPKHKNFSFGLRHQQTFLCKTLPSCSCSTWEPGSMQQYTPPKPMSGSTTAVPRIWQIVVPICPNQICSEIWYESELTVSPPKSSRYIVCRFFGSEKKSMCWLTFAAKQPVKTSDLF